MTMLDFILVLFILACAAAVMAVLTPIALVVHLAWGREGGAKSPAFGFTRR
jgi:hypothetical protein